ncbi:MAG: Rrf2 family transcriptional regulator [Spirochaetes bacterium RBG_13_51_14]|nr:MAG: Rrf2 family transcriptional regulator [Spirochaetes bacterium RBG_13_51_14]
MKLSTKSEYACLALIDLAEHYAKGLIKSEDIARRKKLPKKFLDQILFTLKNSGYVKSKRGSAGGYRLAKTPSQITIAEILRLMDGALAPVYSVSTYFYEKTPIEQNKKMLKILKEIRDYVAEKLEKTTLADIVS